MIQQFFLIILFYSMQLQAPDFTFQGKVKSQTVKSSLSIDKKTQITAAINQQIKTNRLLALKSNNQEELKVLFQSSLKKDMQAKLEIEAKEFDIESVTTQVLCAINNFKKTFQGWMTTSCDGDESSYDFGDVIHDGKKYRQYGFINDKSECTGGWLEPCNPKDNGILFRNYEPIFVKRSQTVLGKLDAIQQQSRANMKMHVIQQDFAYQQHQTANLFSNGLITREEAIRRDLQVQEDKNILNAQREMKDRLSKAQDVIKKRYKAEHPGRIAQHVFGKTPIENTKYSEAEVTSASKVFEAEKIKPGSQDKKLLNESRHIMKCDADGKSAKSGFGNESKNSQSSNVKDKAFGKDVEKGDDKQKKSHQEKDKNSEKESAKKDSTTQNKESVEKGKTDAPQRESSSERDTVNHQNRNSSDQGPQRFKKHTQPSSSTHQSKSSSSDGVQKMYQNMRSSHSNSNPSSYNQSSYNSSPTYRSHSIPRSHESSSGTQTDPWAHYEECLQRSYEEQRQQEQAAAAAAAYRMYVEQKIMKVALLEHHGYVYEPLDRDFTGLIKTQLKLESANRSYNEMGSFSYDYWFSGRPSKIKKEKYILSQWEYNLKDSIRRRRWSWKERSLQEIENNKKAALVKERADRIKSEQERVNKIRIEDKLLVTYGYVFQASEEASQELEATQQELQDTVEASKKDLSVYAYWFKNKRVELKAKAETIKKREIFVQADIAQERRAWREQALDELYSGEKYKSQLAKEVEDRENELSTDATDLSPKSPELQDNDQVVDDTVNMQDLTEYVAKDRSLNKSVKNSKHSYSMSRDITDSIENQLIDRDNEYSGKVSSSEIKMIKYMLWTMTHAHNNMIVEYAQSGLQAWKSAQKAETEEEYDFHLQQFRKYYDSIDSQKVQSFKQELKLVGKDKIDSLLQDYQNILKDDESGQSLSKEKIDNSHTVRLEKRIQALTKSQEQFRANTVIKCDFEMSFETRAYLMAHGMNYAAFDSVPVMHIQNCLTQENLDIIESAIERAQRHGYAPDIQEFTKHTCNLAITAQQLNQRHRIEEAAALTDLNHVNALFAQSMLEDEAEVRGWVAMGNGMSKALYKWYDFSKRLCCQPKQTVKEMADNLCEVGSVLCDVASVAYDHSSLAYQADRAHDIVEELNDRSNSIEASKSLTHVEQRKLKNQQTLQKSMVMAKVVLKNMMEQPVEDTLTSIAEMSFDALLTVKAIESIGYVSSKVGNKLVETGNELKKMLPPKMMDETVVFMKTSSGELIAVSEKSSKSIPKAAQAQAVVNKAERVKKHTEKTKAIVDTTTKFVKPDQAKVAALQKSIQPYLNSEKVVNLEQVKSLKGIEQIEKYRKFTHNFSPEGIAKLKPEEILHLNLCDWLEPQATKINARIKKTGGLKITEVRDGIECIVEIHEFDLYHSLLGEIRPGSIRDHTKGGHLLIPELKAALFDIGEVEHIGNEFFDMKIKYAGKVGGRYERKTYFPMGTTVEESVTMIEDAMKIPKEIRFADINDKGRVPIYITNSLDLKFGLHIEKGIVKYYPMKLIE